MKSVRANSASEERVFWQRGVIREIHVLEILEKGGPRESHNCGRTRLVLPVLETFCFSISPVKRPISQ